MMRPGLVSHEAGSSSQSRLSGVDEIIERRTGFTLRQLITVAQTSRPNILIVGPAPEASGLMNLVTSHLPQPVPSMHCGSALDLPAEGGPAALAEVSTLSPADQGRLLDWFDKHLKACQTIATSCRPLWPMVKEGRFYRRLFYRLNTVTLHVGAHTRGA